MSTLASDAPLLTIEDLSIRYGRVQALEHVSLDVRTGEVVALIGANGAGKSTALRSISRIIPVQRGRIAFAARDITGARPSDVVRLGIAQVPEGRRMLARQTVLDNLLLGAYTRADTAAIQADVEQQFARFPRLAERRRQLAGTLSGGEQQMLAIARALMSTPRILLVDEPSVGLAPILVSRVIAKIRELKAQHDLTVLMAEQNFNQATKIADRGYIIVHGQIEFEGRSTRELTEHDLVKKYYLGL